jgi:hypothetical protein
MISRSLGRYLIAKDVTSLPSRRPLSFITNTHTGLHENIVRAAVSCKVF